MHKNNMLVSSLLFSLFFLANSLSAITFDNKPLNEIIKQGECLVITPQDEFNFVAINIKNNNIDAWTGDINKLKNLQECFNDVINTSGCTFKSGTVHQMVSGDTMNYAGMKATAGEKILLRAKNSLNLVHGLLDCKEIRFTSNIINLMDCFLVNPDKLYMISTTPETECTAIVVTFKKNLSKPTVITGKIDFVNNESEELLFSNVEKIEIVFSEKAWN